MCEFYLPYGAIMRSKLNNFCKVFAHHAWHLVRALHMTALIVTFRLSDLLSLFGFFVAFPAHHPLSIVFSRDLPLTCALLLWEAPPLRVYVWRENVQEANLLPDFN